MVAVSPFSSPAAASTSEPVHTDVVNVVESCAVRTQSSTRSSSIKRSGAEPAGEHDDVRGRQLLERGVDLDAEHAVVRPDHAMLVADEGHVELRDALQDLVRADAVERREVGEERDCDAGHPVTVTWSPDPVAVALRRGAGSVAGWTYASE